MLPVGKGNASRASLVAYRWHWVEGVDATWREALVRAFDPAALDPVPTAPARAVRDRAYGVLTRVPGLPVDVFVKVFIHQGLAARLRHLRGRSGAAREFASAVRMHGMGLPVPRPLALVDETGPWGCRASYCLTERVAGARPLSAILCEAGGGRPAAREAAAAGAARLVVELAARGVWHRDTSAENLLVVPGAGGGPARLVLVDARHARFGAEPATALEEMLVALGAFLVVGRAEPTVVQALVAEAAATASARGLGGAVREEDVLDRIHRSGTDLLARHVRKGKRPPEDLDAFAQRYATAADAANYRDRRFGRSRHGRGVDAAERRIVAEVVAGLGIRGPVLDAPCGAGRLLPLLGAEGRACVGADVSPEMLALARRVAAEARLACGCLAADARRLPFADGRFELALSMRLLHRVRQPEERVAVLRELARVSRGWVLFSFYNRRSWRGLRDRLRGRYAGETRAAIRREAAAAGMAPPRFLPVGPLARQTLALCAVAAQGPGPRGGSPLRT
jgi:SAM-dependent methyltransferase